MAVRRAHRGAGGGKEHSAVPGGVPRAGDPCRRSRHGARVDRGARRVRVLAAVRRLSLGRGQLGDSDRRGAGRAREALLHRPGLPASHGRRRRRARGLAAAARQSRCWRPPSSSWAQSLRRIFLPVLPVETFIAYQRALAFRPKHGRKARARRTAAILRRPVRLARDRQGARRGLSGATAGRPRATRPSSPGTTATPRRSTSSARRGLCRPPSAATRTIISGARAARTDASCWCTEVRASGSPPAVSLGRGGRPCRQSLRHAGGVRADRLALPRRPRAARDAVAKAASLRLSGASFDPSRSPADLSPNAQRAPKLDSRYGDRVEDVGGYGDAVVGNRNERLYVSPGKARLPPPLRRSTSRSAMSAVTSIPAGRSVTSHVETLAAETSGLTRPLILERGSIVFRRRLMPWEWRRLACACQRCQDGAPELSCRPPLPTFFQKFQTAATHKTSSLCIAVLHTREGTARDAGVVLAWISFPSRRSFIQSWR